jgi:hypothetical protein
MCYLTFEYTKNKQGVDMFSSQVKNLDVYVFDSERKYVKCFSDERSQLMSTTSYSMPINLPDGTYTFVVWAGAKDDYLISDNNGQLLQPYITAFNHSRLTLNKINVNENFPEELFWGITEQVDISTKKQIHIELIKNTKKIHLTVDGIQNIRRSTNHDLLDITCNVANGEFKFDNSISLPERLFQYIPVEQTYNENVFECNIKTLRLLTDMKSELAIKDPTTGKDIFNHNLIELLLLSPEINNNEDLDTNDEYDIAISMNINLDTKITVNGYTVLDSDQHLQ